MRRILIVSFLAVVLAAIGSAQNFRGGISGIVTDQSGAIVPEAALKATNQATSLTYSTTASTAGEFAFTDLPLGSYTVVVSRPGFSVLTINASACRPDPFTTCRSSWTSRRSRPQWRCRRRPWP